MQRTIVRLSTLLLLSRALSAQEIRGIVLDSASREPISGAVLMLLDSAGVVLGRNLSIDRGVFRMSVDGEGQRARTIRVVRIGFRPRMISVAVPATGALELTVPMTALPTMLEPVRVRDQPACPARADRPVAFALWEQAQSALLGMVVAREGNPATMERAIYARRIDAKDNRIVRQTARLDSSTLTTKSFHAVRTASEFVRLGFRDIREKGAVYLGPDAEVLLDDAFLTGYCLRVAESNASRPNEVGLSFDAADHQRDRIDIAGTFWIDTIARELHDVEFAYRGLDSRLENLRPGGYIEFRAMSNGIAQLVRWYLRVVGLDSTIVVSRRGPIDVRTTPYAEEDGGELVAARWPDGTTWRNSLGAVAMRAVNRENRPAAGVSVVLDETGYRGTVDTAGILKISNLVPGPYTMSVDDPRLAPVGLTIQTGVSFVAARDSTVRTSVMLPSAQDFVGAVCVREGKTALGDSTWLLLRVLTSDGKPVSDIKVRLRQEDERGTWVLLHDEYETGADGVFALCRGLRRSANVIVEIRVGTEHEDIQLQLTGNLTVARVPFRTSAR